MTHAFAEKLELSFAAPLPDYEVRRAPFYLLSRQQPLAAWLHAPLQGNVLDHGVVICPPLGYEQVHAHRSLRRLADAIAALGLPCLRFDWHGTGDSDGCDSEPSRLETWSANARDALQWMRSALHCRKVSVIGLRIGALLAAQAIEKGTCENFVLWAPVSCGKAYVRQMQTIDRMAEKRPTMPGAAAGDIEAGGFLLTEETTQQLRNLQLSASGKFCEQALLATPFEPRLVDLLEQNGMSTGVISPGGFPEMMLEPHLSSVPQQALREITKWLAEKSLTSSANPLTIHWETLGPSETLLAGPCHQAAASWGVLRERLWNRIGDDHLVGVMTESSKPASEKPAIVLLNGGSTHHIGPGRLYVDLARHLAGQGFSCLRLDLRGLGESADPRSKTDNDCYPATAFEDVASTLEALRTELGAKRFVLMGLCSGAYAAFQAAAQLSDRSLVESILINPLTYYWCDGMSLDLSAIERQIKEHASITRATNLSKLWKFLRGKTEIGYAEAFRLLLRRTGHSLAQQFAPAPTFTGPQCTSLGHPQEENLPADLLRVQAAGRRLTMFLAEGDPGQTILSYHAPRQMRSLQRAGVLSISTIASADHTFSRRQPRAELVKKLSEHLQRRYGE